PNSSSSGPPTWVKPQVTSKPPPKVRNQSTPRSESGCGGVTPNRLIQLKLYWLYAASAMSIARSKSTLNRNPAPVLIQAIREPRPNPLSKTEVSIPPTCDVCDTLSNQSLFE